MLRRLSGGAGAAQRHRCFCPTPPVTITEAEAMTEIGGVSHISAAALVASGLFNCRAADEAGYAAFLLE